MTCTVLIVLSCIRAVLFMTVPGSGNKGPYSVLDMIFDSLPVCLQSEPRHCHPVARDTVMSQAAQQCCHRGSHRSIACIQPQHLHLNTPSLSQHFIASG